MKTCICLKDVVSSCLVWVMKVTRLLSSKRSCKYSNSWIPYGILSGLDCEGKQWGVGCVGQLNVGSLQCLIIHTPHCNITNHLPHYQARQRKYCIYIHSLSTFKNLVIPRTRTKGTKTFQSSLEKSMWSSESVIQNNPKYRYIFKKLLVNTQSFLWFKTSLNTY